MGKRIAAACIAVLFVLPNTVAAQDNRYVPVTGSAEAPRGFVALCREDAQLCSALGGTPERADAPLTEATASIVPAVHSLPLPSTPPAQPDADPATLLARVNRLVNGHVRQRTDLAQFGQGELWRRSGIGRDAVGDCEDIAIEKRLQLIAAGYPAERLFFAVVYRRDLGLHVVLVARTDAGDMVLDSRSPYVRPWSEAAYDWISAQAPGEAGRWKMVAASAGRS
ncbi:transglutaminase-like cysteine peptidase [Sphingomonas pokkalii]|uniref:Transglutaminase n=1 Tax=Sphingomonas pokkalii TaxID=2175090 RepID=A0A2U0SGM2_9SPHN|nr:transglutaminase-like cysteine peptidase [Sphingomonas pokkalii]PVX30471.1 transglutaminase [Sphingomonas pokkalii]